MLPDELQYKYDHLMRNVTLMRHHQRLYKQFYASDDDRKMKYYQKIVDDLIIEDVKTKKSKQREMF